MIRGQDFYAITMAIEKGIKTEFVKDALYRMNMTKLL